MSYTNHDVAHLWFNQSKATARSSNGNFHFDGPNIYSYRTRIARLILHDNGSVRAVLRTSETFSQTTSGKHETAISAAINGVVICGPNLDADTIQSHDHNLGYLRRGIATLAAKARRSLNRANWAWHAVELQVDAAIEYCELFGLDASQFAVPDDMTACLAKSAERQRKLDNPDPAKRERERVRRLAKRREQEAEAARLLAIRNAEAVAEWREGRGGTYGLPWGLPVMLRIQPGHPDTLETSKGARVPVAAAIQVFKMAAATRDGGKAWPDGLTHRVGDFHVDAIDSDGTIHAGCHTIAWDESARMAAVLGVS